MKKYFFFAMSVLMMTSCATKMYVQIVDVGSNSVPEDNNNYVFSDANCKITYDFWKDGGESGFIVENISEDFLYVDLAKSFFLSNERAYDYYKQRKYISETGVGIASPYIVGIDKAGIEYEEKAIIAIPPHTYKVFSEYHVLDDVIQDCSVRLFSKRNTPESISYSEESAPLRFGNYITYKRGEDGQEEHVANDFYIRAVTNYNQRDVMKKRNVGCKKQKIIVYNKFRNGKKFYIQYDRNHNKDYSADASQLNTQ